MAETYEIWLFMDTPKIVYILENICIIRGFSYIHF